MKTAIANNVQLAYPRDDMIQCMFTDANETSASGMVTQIPIDDINKPVSLQRHEPLGFVGHRFNKCEMNWSVAEKEGFAIKDTMQKLDYLLQMKRPFKLFCDHKNLIQIFSPTNVSKPTAQKLQRWALYMQRFHYKIEHIKGEENIWAHLMTRWGTKPVDEEAGSTHRLVLNSNLIPCLWTLGRRMSTHNRQRNPAHRPQGHSDVNSANSFTW